MSMSSRGASRRPAAVTDTPHASRRHLARACAAALDLAVLTADVVRGGPLSRLDRAVPRIAGPAAPLWRRLSQLGDTSTVATLTVEAITAGSFKEPPAPWWRPVAVVPGLADDISRRRRRLTLLHRNQPPSAVSGPPPALPTQTGNKTADAAALQFTFDTLHDYVDALWFEIQWLLAEVAAAQESIAEPLGDLDSGP